MKRTNLTAEVLVADTETLLFIPADTRRLEFSTPSAFPLRVSFVQGDVAAESPAGFIVSNGSDTLRIGRFDGPVFFAADQPHALLDVVAWSSKELISTAPTGGEYSDAFGAGYVIGQ